MHYTIIAIALTMGGLEQRGSPHFLKKTGRPPTLSAMHSGVPLPPSGHASVVNKMKLVTCTSD